MIKTFSHITTIPLSFLTKLKKDLYYLIISHKFPVVTSFNPRGEGPCPRSHGRKREKWNLHPGSLGRAVTTASLSQSRASPSTPRWRVLVKEVCEEGGWGWMTKASGADSLFRKPLGGAPRATKLSPPGGQTERCRETAERSRRRTWAARCRCCYCWLRPAFQVGAGCPNLCAGDRVRPEGREGGGEGKRAQSLLTWRRAQSPAPPPTFK